MGRADAPFRPCVLCPHDRKNRAVHDHHVEEVSFGGPMDGRTLPLCAGCHDQVHRIANNIERGKLTLDSLPRDPPWYSVLSILLRNRARFRASGAVAVDARRRVTAELSDAELKMAHVVKRAGGFTSIEAMLKGLIIGAYKKIHYGQR